MQLTSGLGSHRNNPETYLLFAVAIVALVVRLAYVATVPNTLTFDEPTYNDIVTNLLAGNGYSFSGNAYYTSLPFSPTSFQEPLYPFFLAGIYRVTGLGAFALARMLQAVLNATSIVLLMLIASSLWNRRIAFIVGMIGAVWIPFIYFTGLLMTENLFVFWLLLFFCFWVNAIQQEKQRLFFVAGVLYAAACLTRGMFLYFLPILLLVTLVVSRKRRPGLPYPTILLLIGTLITIAPWTYRNYVVHNAFVPITTKGGYNLYVYTYPAEDLEFNARFDEIPIPDMNGLTEIQRESKFQSLAIENIKSYPLLELKFALFKLLDFWNPLAGQGPWYARVLYVVMFGGLVILAVIGAIQMLIVTNLRAPGVLIVSLVLFYTLGAAVFTGGGKARLSIESLLILSAGSEIVLIIRTITRINTAKHSRTGNSGAVRD